MNLLPLLLSPMTFMGIKVKLRIQARVSPGLVAGVCRIDSPVGYFHKLLSLLPHPSSKTPVFPLSFDR